MAPINAAGAASQCCSKSAAKAARSPSPSKDTSWTVKWPLTTLQPRPSPETSRSGRPGAEKRPALSYVPGASVAPEGGPMETCQYDENPKLDRKSTRLNSSHVAISYAV